MPYHIEKKGGGYKVTSPNHPGGFSKHPQTKGEAEAQRRAILANDHEDHGKSRPKKVVVRKKK
jgi:hypothetical protein